MNKIQVEQAILLSLIYFSKQQTRRLRLPFTMKFVAVTLLALIAAAYSAPTSVSDNNIGNIVSVDISGSLDIDNTVNQSIVNVLLAYLNQQAVIVAPGGGNDDENPGLPTPSKLSPEMIQNLKSMLAKH